MIHRVSLSFWIVIVAGFLQGNPSSAIAVVIQGGDGAGNTNAPIDDPGWDNVGIRGGPSGVYLGNRWVLTANHVGAGNITLAGSSYAYETGSSFRLTNSGGGFADLLMFRLTTDPGLPTLSISLGTPTTGSTLTMIGHGNSRATNQTYWSVNTTTNPWVWTETNAGAANASGFFATNAQTMRWGENFLESTQTVSSTRTFNTTFSSSGGSNEAQGTFGDSGGGVFYKNGTNWELAGLTIAVGAFSGQPSGAGSAVFGDATYIADLSLYRDQIVIQVPEPSILAYGLVIGAGLLGLNRKRIFHS